MFTDRATTPPSAAPVASAGVSRPVSKNYTPPFAYQGTIDSIEIEIGDAGLDPDEEAKLHAQFRAGKEY